MVTLGEALLELGEGPGYDPLTNMAWWFDILGKRLFLHAVGQAWTEVFELPFAASAMSYIKDRPGQLLLAEDGLYLRDTTTGALDLHLALPMHAGGIKTRSNDARVHPSGAFWVSTMGWNAEDGAGSIYHYRAGRLQLLRDGISIPNAICFAPGGRVAYFADTARAIVFRVETDPATGLPISEPEVFLSDFDGGPDGAVTDRAGNIWIAIWGGRRVAGFSADGRPIGELRVPATQPSCPAFIGADARQMLVTTARVGLTEDQLAAAPDEGATFVLGLAFQGEHDPRVVV